MPTFQPATPAQVKKFRAQAESEYNAKLTLGKHQTDPNKETPWQRQQREKYEQSAQLAIPDAVVM